jgi:hypothetical protein
LIRKELARSLFAAVAMAETDGPLRTLTGPLKMPSESSLVVLR